MYYKLHSIQEELVCYHNDWGKLDFLRRWLLVANGYMLDILRPYAK